MKNNFINLSYIKYIFQLLYLKYIYIYYSFNLLINIFLFKKIIFFYFKLNFEINIIYLYTLKKKNNFIKNNLILKFNKNWNLLNFKINVF